MISVSALCCVAVTCFFSFTFIRKTVPPYNAITPTTNAIFKLLFLRIFRTSAFLSCNSAEKKFFCSSVSRFFIKSLNDSKLSTASTSFKNEFFSFVRTSIRFFSYFSSVNLPKKLQIKFFHCSNSSLVE